MFIKTSNVINKEMQLEICFILFIYAILLTVEKEKEEQKYFYSKCSYNFLYLLLI